MEQIKMKKSKLAIVAFVVSVVTLIFALSPLVSELEYLVENNWSVRYDFDWFFDALFLAMLLSAIFAWLVGLISLVLGAVSLIVVKVKNLGGKKLAIASIIISALSVIVWFWIEEGGYGPSILGNW